MKIDFQRGREILEARLVALEALRGVPRLAIGPDSDLSLLTLEEIPQLPRHYRGKAVMIPKNQDGTFREPYTLLDGKPWSRPSGSHLYEGSTLWGPASGGPVTWTGNLIEPVPGGTAERFASETPFIGRCAPSRTVHVSISLAGFEVTLGTHTGAEGGGPGANLEARGRPRPCYWEALREAGAALEALHAKCAPSWLELLRLGAKENPHGKEEE